MGDINEANPIILRTKVLAPIARVRATFACARTAGASPVRATVYIIARVVVLAPTATVCATVASACATSATSMTTTVDADAGVVILASVTGVGDPTVAGTIVGSSNARSMRPAVDGKTWVIQLASVAVIRATFACATVRQFPKSNGEDSFFPS